jgi:uncharacterized protein DUF6390
VSTSTRQEVPAGYALFAQYAFPPNELGYCGPADADVLLRRDSAAAVASHATEFDGIWPYLNAIAEAAGIADPLGEDVVRSYWVGGPLLDRVDSDALLCGLRSAFAGQVTGALTEPALGGALAHHSFHVFVVYPWVRFLDRDPTTPLSVMQDCRVRWGTVREVDDDWVVVSAPPLTFVNRRLGLGEPVDERLRWRRDGLSLAPRPAIGQTVSAHWDWVCGALNGDEVTALEAATQSTLDLVNSIRT